jgi:hypothetical protein
VRMAEVVHKKPDLESSILENLSSISQAIPWDSTINYLLIFIEGL